MGFRGLQAQGEPVAEIVPTPSHFVATLLAAARHVSSSSPLKDFCDRTMQFEVAQHLQTMSAGARFGHQLSRIGG
jgi:hypothetical protein